MRRPVSLLAGLMWLDPDVGPAAAQSLRHEAQERDGALETLHCNPASFQGQHTPPAPQVVLADFRRA